MLWSKRIPHLCWVSHLVSRPSLLYPVIFLCEPHTVRLYLPDSLWWLLCLLLWPFTTGQPSLKQQDPVPLKSEAVLGLILATELCMKTGRWSATRHVTSRWTVSEPAVFGFTLRPNNWQALRWWLLLTPLWVPVMNPPPAS